MFRSIWHRVRFNTYLLTWNISWAVLKQTSQCRWGQHKALKSTYSEKVLHQEYSPNFEYKSVKKLYFIISVNTNQICYI